MWKQLYNTNRIWARTFLSDAYKCTDTWNARLTSPVLQNIKPETFYYELENKFQQHGKCSAIDVDIFTNKLTDGGYLQEVADIMHKLRQTEETSDSLVNKLIKFLNVKLKLKKKSFFSFRILQAMLLFAFT